MDKLIELKANKITFCLWKLGMFGLLFLSVHFLPSISPCSCAHPIHTV